MITEYIFNSLIGAVIGIAVGYIMQCIKQGGIIREFSFDWYNFGRHGWVWLIILGLWLGFGIVIKIYRFPGH